MRRGAATPVCPEHAIVNHGGAEAVGRCTRCERVLCTACRRFSTQLRRSDFYCDSCADDLRSEARPRWLRALVIALIATALVAFVAQHVPWWVSTGAEIALLGFALNGARPKRSMPLQLLDVSSRPTLKNPHVVSGKWVTAVMALSFATTALLLPAFAHQPKWVEVELVLCGWWLVLTATLTTLLYRGHWVRNDLFAGERLVDSGGRSPSERTSWFDVGALVDFEAIGMVLVGIAAAVAAWLVAELVVPLVVMLLYGLFIRAITHITNSDQRSKGSVVSALGRASAWSLVYLVPLSGIVWVVHRVR